MRSLLRLADLRSAIRLRVGNKRKEPWALCSRTCTHRFALQSLTWRRVTCLRSIRCFHGLLSMHSGYLTATPRRVTDSDLYTSFEKRWSKPYSGSLCRFAEVVHFRKAGKFPNHFQRGKKDFGLAAKRSRANTLWRPHKASTRPAHFVGVRRRSRFKKTCWSHFGQSRGIRRVPARKPTTVCFLLEDADDMIDRLPDELLKRPLDEVPGPELHFTPASETASDFGVQA